MKKLLFPTVNFASFLGKVPSFQSGEITEKRIFHQMIELERQRVHRTNKEFSILIFNLDFLITNGKTVEALVRQIRRRIRRTDFLGQYDENRLGLLLTNTSPTGAQTIGKTIIDTLCADCAFPLPSDTLKVISYPDQIKPAN